MKSDLLSINNNLDILISPLIEIQYTPVDFIQRDYSGYIFTSENAILSLLSSGISLRNVDVFCVGKQTQKLAIKSGFNVLGTYPRVELLVRDLGELKFKGKLFYLRGDFVSCDLKTVLWKKEILLEELIVYKQLACTLSEKAFGLLASKPCLIPLYSARTAKHFSKEVSRLPGKEHLIFCISEKIKSEVTLDWDIECSMSDLTSSYQAQICHLAGQSQNR